jgi:hypothetical protein
VVHLLLEASEDVVDVVAFNVEVAGGGKEHVLSFSGNDDIAAGCAYQDKIMNKTTIY